MKMRISQFSRAWLALIVVAFWCGGGATRAAVVCSTFPSGYVPFTQTYTTYSVSPGSLVMGAMTLQSYTEMINSIPLPQATDEMFCGPVQLAPGYYVYAYVPTASERYGNFSAYLPTQLYDPIDNSTIPSNILPADAIGMYFPWHIAGPAPSPTGFTQAMISIVNTLYSQAVLNSGQTNSLVKMLEHAIQMISAGKNAGAIGILQSFISEVQDLESSGILTTGQAEVLINDANDVIFELT
jgi:hypothetical protein